MFGILVGCGSDDSPQTSSAGSGGQASLVTGAADAGRPLPGEGFEATPDFDINNRQKPVPAREQLIEAVSTLNGTGAYRGSVVSESDAGTDAGADAGVP